MMLHIKFKIITNAATRYQIFCLHIPPALGMGSIGQNSTFSEHGRVAHQIKEIQECSNMVPNILPADAHPPPPDPRDVVNRLKFDIFRTWSCRISN